MATATFKFLHFANLKDIPNWSVQYADEEDLGFTKRFPMARIRSFLTRRKESIDIQDGVIYKRVTVSTKGGNISIRDEKDGKNIGTKKQFLIHEGQFLLSKIDARNGAFGVVPAIAEKAIITGNFWTFDVDYSKINPQFLTLITKSKEFLSFAEKSSNGTTNRHYLQEKAFLNQQIPLPSIEEQKKILNQYNEHIKQASDKQEDILSLSQKSHKVITDLLGIKQKEAEANESLLQFIRLKDTTTRWDAFAETFSIESKYHIYSLGKYIVQISTGTTPPTTHPEYFDGDVKFFTPADLGNDKYLTCSSRTITDLAITDKKARVFHRGDILFVGIGSTVGKVGIVEDEFVSSNQQITGFTIDSSKINPEYVYYYLNYNRDIATAAQSKTTLPIVNQDKIRKIPIVVPPIEIQNQIVLTLDKMYITAKQNEKEIPLLKEKAFSSFEHIIFD
ncbi:MAG: restriction endonuclease subunit S [Bacteroidales bacterium]|nr:restriction endonuclease subunit S [Bacteroidales bacterium]